jgi:hypothetical protein
MKLLLTGLIALSMVGYSRADGFGTGIGIGIGLALANRAFSGGQPRQHERVVQHEHRTVVQRTVVIHEKPAPLAPPTSTTVVVNNNLPAQPAQPAPQLTSTTTVNTSAVTNSPAPITPLAPVAATVTTPSKKELVNNITFN